MPTDQVGGPTPEEMGIAKKREGNRVTVEIKYTEPNNYSDGNGSLEIRIGDKSEKIRFNSKYFKKEDINRIKKLLEDAENEEARDTISETIKKATNETKLGQYVMV